MPTAIEERSVIGVEQRVLPIEELRVATDEEGKAKIIWYASVFDQLSEDLGGWKERVNRRAFTKAVQQDVRAFFNHDPNMMLGRSSAGTLKLHVDLHGLLAEVTPPNTTYARDLLEIVSRGDIGGGSIGFRVARDRWAIEEGDVLVREVVELERLYDVSLVSLPAFPGTEGSAHIRSLGPTDEDLRRIWADLMPSETRSIPIGLRRRQLELARLRF